MTRAAEELIRELTQDLAPVRPIPRLRRVAGVVLGLSAVAVALAAVLGTAAGLLVPRLPDPTTAAVLVAHLTLAAGALFVSLASCVPGRGRLEGAGLALATIGAGGTAGVALLLTRTLALDATARVVAGDALVCTLLATLPALVPAILLVRFAAVGAPARPLRSLGFAAIASLALATVPGHVGCPVPGALHSLLGHLLAPVAGGLLILAAIWPLYRNTGRSVTAAR
jgi:hypothetical protein